MDTQRTGNPTVRNGLIFGAILGLLGVGSAVLAWLTSSIDVVSGNGANGVGTVNISYTGPSGLLTCAIFLAMLALTFVAGIVTARKTGRVGSGAVTGLLTGVVGALLGNLAGLIVIVAFVAPGYQPSAGSTMTPSQGQALLIGISIGSAVFGVLLDGGLGAGMGALGGLIGANSYRTATLRSQPAYVPGYPGYPGGYPGYSGGYPPYPGAPDMPPQGGSAPQPWPYGPPSQQPPQSDLPPYPQW